MIRLSKKLIIPKRLLKTFTIILVSAVVAVGATKKLKDYIQLKKETHLTALTNASDPINPISQVIPPSPEAAALGSYGNTPISLYTGTPNISVPLYNVKSGNLELPIGLSYDASGRRVEEIASNVGLGWVLNAGGVITRSIRGGLPDEVAKSYYIPPDGGNYDQGYWECQHGYFVGSQNFDEKNFDTEPDVYFYNFNGITGKFVFDENKNLVSIPHNDLKITPVWTTYTNPQLGCTSYSEIDKFEVLTTTGVKYTFSVKERTKAGQVLHFIRTPAYTTLPPNNSVYEYISSWYLQKIEHPNHDQITFEYANQGIQNGHILRTDTHDPATSSGCKCGTGKPTSNLLSATGTTFSVYGSPNSPYFWEYTYTENRDHRRINRINFQNGYIKFNTANRQDIYMGAFFGVAPSSNQKAITGFQVYINGNKLKEFDFNQSYWTSSGINSASTSFQPYYKRLRLDGIVEKDKDGNIKSNQPYEFTYNSTTLPNRLSFEQDIWGYYNNNGANDLIPQIYIYNTPTGDRYSALARSGVTPTYTLTGADRSSDLTYMKANILERITYPTGGTSSFDYEMNEFQNNGYTYQGGGLRIKQMTDHDGMNTMNDIITDYNYILDASTNTSGYATGIPQFANLCKNVTGSDVPNNTVRTSETMGVLGQAMGSTIGYSRVEVVQTGNGKTVYEYTSPNDQPDVPPVYSTSGSACVSDYTMVYNTYDRWPFVDGTSMAHRRGLLLKEQIYDESGQLKSELENTYNYKQIASFKVKKYANYGKNYQQYFYRVNEYDILAEIPLLAQVSNTLDNVNSVINYTYDPTSSHHLPIEIRTTNSDGTEHIQKTKYSSEYVFTSTPTASDEMAVALEWMQNNNVIIPTEQINQIKKPGWSSPKTIGGQFTKYKLIANAGSSFLTTDKIYQIETVNPISNFSLSSISNGSIQYGSAYALKGTLDETDDKGNPLQYTQTHSQPVSVIWNDDKTLPLAKVVNAAPDEIYYNSFEGTGTPSSLSKTGDYYKSVIYGYTIDGTNILSGDYILTYWKKNLGTGNWEYVEETKTHTIGNNISTASFLGHIDEVRLRPIDALITTYCYDLNTWQVITITDNNNQSLYYEYDKFQRLKYVKDFEGNVIKAYDYNYKDVFSTTNTAYNYVRSIDFLTDGVASLDDAAGLSLAQKSETYQYLDGLGRTIQSVAVGQGSDQEDIVQHYEYDQYGRQAKSFLPYTNASNGGMFRTNAANEQLGYILSKYSTTKGYAESEFEHSPMNRGTEQSQPGNAWQLNSGRNKEVSFRTNLFDNVYDFENGQYFAPGELFVTQTQNNNGGNHYNTYLYKDKLGRNIMTRTELSSTDFADTYILNNDMGQIEQVLPPEASKKAKNNSWSLTGLDELIYKYEYDERGNIVRKKVPSKDWIDIIYDKLNRPVLTQDGNSRLKNEWSFTKFDILGRAIISGIYDNTTNAYTKAQLQVQIDNNSLFENLDGATSTGYTTLAFPKQPNYFTVHTVSYYDDYDFDEDGTADFSFEAKGSYSATDAFDRIHGQLTMTKVLVLDGANNKWLWTASFFDDRNRPIQTQMDNNLGGRDVTTQWFDFSGKTLASLREHTVSGKNPLKISTSFTYDHAGRLLTTNVLPYYQGSTVKFSPITLSALEYDDIGQMIEKKLHSTNGQNYLQNIDYKYNIQGWLTQINDINFGQLSSAGLAEEISKGLIDKIKDADIDIEVDVSELNAGNYDRVEVKEDYSEEKGGQTALKSESKTVELTVNSLQSSLTDILDFDYSGRTVEESTYDQEFGKLRTDLATEMDNLGITDQYARDLVEDEVLGHFRDEWIRTTANDNDDDLFAMRIDYLASNAATGAVGQYNGNISQTTWRVRGKDKQTYGYQYDNLGRLTQANYTEIDDANNYIHQGRYSVSNISYDLNGNIQTLQRNGLIAGNAATPTFGTIDNLNYTYSTNSNQLKAVADAATVVKGFKDLINHSDYIYDENGNMIEDRNKNIRIEYNHLNLPTKVVWRDETGKNDINKFIEFTYDAVGIKLKKRAVDQTNSQNYESVKHYVGGIEYTETGGVYTFEAWYHSEGRMTEQNGKFEFDYAIRDHLGNTRVVFRDLNKDGQVDETEILDEKHYYPFGHIMEGIPNANGNGYAYQYNGKEMNSDFGLDWLDYGARWYDATLARWSAVDPMSESMMKWSEYNYTFNNPISFTDPDGMMPDFAGEGVPSFGPRTSSRDKMDYGDGDGAENINLDLPTTVNLKQTYTYTFKTIRGKVDKLEVEILYTFSVQDDGKLKLVDGSPVVLTPVVTSGKFGITIETEQQKLLSNKETGLNVFEVVIRIAGGQVEYSIGLDVPSTDSKTGLTMGRAVTYGSKSGSLRQLIYAQVEEVYSESGIQLGYWVHAQASEPTASDISYVRGGWADRVSYSVPRNTLTHTLVSILERPKLGKSVVKFTSQTQIQEYNWRWSLAQQRSKFATSTTKIKMGTDKNGSRTLISYKVYDWKIDPFDLEDL